MQDTGSPSDSKTLLAGAAEAQASAPVSSSITASTLTDSAAIEAVPVPAAIVHAQPPTGAALTSASPTAIAKSELTEADYGPCPRTFDEMGLSEDVASSLRDMGFSEPMPVQQRVYRAAIAGRDLIVQSRTGSGKTAAFGIPFVQSILDPKADVRNGFPQVLALGPTRELALQVSNEIGRIAAKRQLSITAIYGGAPMGRQVDALKAGAHLVSGTPGRVLDHIRRGTLNLSKVKALVLDEADEMLSMGFLEDITEILKRCPPERQTLLFSATIPDEVLRLQHRYLRSPLNIHLSGEGISAAEIVHAYYMVTGMGRMRDLLRVIEIERPESAIIFCNTREETSAVAEFLRNNGHDAEPISSDLNQTERERVMKRMKAKDLKFLCATDVAARGIDISDLPFVINYTFPESAEVYVHRTGRTGRAGKRGIAVSLISPRELGNFYYLKLTYKIRPEERALPTEAEVQTLREGQFMDRLHKDLGSKNPGPEYRSLLRRLLASESGESVLAMLLEQHLNHRPSRPTHPPQGGGEGPSRPTERRPPREDDRRPREDDRRPREDDRRPREDDRRPRDDAGRPARPAPAPRPEVPAPRAEAPAPRPEVAVPRAEAPAPRAETPALRPEAAAPRTEAPAPRSEGSVLRPEGPGRGGDSRNVGEDRRPRDDRRPGRDEDRRGRDDRRPGRDDGRRRDGDRDRGRGPRRDEPGERSAEPAQVPAPIGTPQGSPTDIIHTDDGREFWEAWADSRAKTSKPSDAPSTEPAVRVGEVPAPDDGGDRRPRRPLRDSRPPSPGEVRLYLNVGRRDNLDDSGLRQFVAAQGLPEIPMELHSSHAYLFVPEEQVEPTIVALSAKPLGTRAVVCERARK